MKLYNALRNLLRKINYTEKDLFAFSLAFSLTAVNIVIAWLFHIHSAWALPLICVSVSPIYILAFGAGIYYSVISTICSFILLGFLEGFTYATIQIALLWLPALIGSILVSLHKQQEDGYKVFLPLPQIFFSLLLLNILLISSFLTVILHNSENVLALKTFLSNQLNYISAASSDLPASMQLHFIEIKKVILNNFLKILGCLVSLYNVVFMLSNLYVGLSLSRYFNLLPRKSFYWPKDLRLPLAAIAIFAIALIALLWLKSTAVALYAIIVASNFAIAFFMCGIAYWHDITRRNRFRFLILSFTYIGLLFSVSSPPLCCTVLLMGLWSTIKHYKTYKYLL